MGEQQGGHVFDRVVGLQVSCLVGDHGIADTVGLVEGVTGEGFDQFEHLLGHLERKALLFGSLQEADALLLHDLRDLLAHRLAHDIGLAQAVAGKFPHDEEYLVLVDDDAIGLLQDSLQGRMGVGDRLQAVFGLDESGYVVHRAGAVERHHGGHVTELGRLQFLQVASHPRAFQLEDTSGLPRGQQFKGLSVVQWKPLQVHINPPVLGDDLSGP